jgi:predicted lysophospholipase L1 biosynthesis ABC-type transport system permease subunit
MQIQYDWPDMPIGTPMSFGGLLVLNGQVMEMSEEDQEVFKRNTGLTFTQAARSTTQLTIPRKKVSN